ncbi:class F sortase [Actinomadura opuntiae]|uniref:class F sortase n=1 Tax=Actinomadura sp. OS1-43 TaxID=604315 RepID=UPI00255ACD57|nr:class F sortase [Actinomadura sp. OS1-43]MDL4818558.1 class F sortase [Actinomadura sp. OS1-43]
MIRRAAAHLHSAPSAVRAALRSAVQAATGRRNHAVPATAAALATTGAAVIAYTLTSQQHAPQPPLTDGAPLRAQAGAAGPIAVPSASPLSYAVPTRIDIPAIKVSAAIITLGLNDDGTLQVPPPGPDYDKAAWYTGSAAPGQPGTAVIEGHLDSARDGPSVFYRLGAARPGDLVTITRTDHHNATYRVDTIKRYRKTAFPTDTVFRDTDTPSLRLITCGGHFDTRSHHYTDNTVVFATLATPPSTPPSTPPRRAHTIAGVEAAEGTVTADRGEPGKAAMGGHRVHLVVGG